MTDRRFTAMLARRGLHRSRSVAVSIALALLALAGLAVGVLGIAPAVGLALPVTLPSVLAALAADSLIAWIVVGVLAVAGLVAIVSALTPARRARHRLDDDRSVVLVDDDVLAGAVSGHAARASGIAADQVTTTVSARALRTTVRATSGHPLDRETVADEVRGYAAGLRPAGRLRTRADVEASGVVGA